MVEKKYTPGSWKLLNVDLSNKNLHQRVGPVICKNHISEPDAHLISAAPDLLEALERALKELELIRSKDTGAVYDITIRIDARAAIAKAYGRE